VFPFVLLLIAIAYVPFASQRSTIDAAIDREQSRHGLMVKQIAGRLEEEGGHLCDMVERIADLVGSRFADKEGISDLLGQQWASIRDFHRVDGMQIIALDKDVIAFTGIADARDDLVMSAFQPVADRALGVPEAIHSDVWCGGMRGLHLVLARGVTGLEGETLGAVIASINLQDSIEDLFPGGDGRSGIAFTVETEERGLVLDSGIGRLATERTPGRCYACHEGTSFDGRDLKPGGNRDVFRQLDEPRVTASAPIRIAGESWKISASTPVSEVMRPFAQQMIVSLFFTGAVVILILLLGVFLRRGHIRQFRLENELQAKARLLFLAREKERLDSELEASRRMATIGEMVARVAHEVKNPLQYMGTAVELLAQTSRDPDSRGLVDDIRTGVRTLDSIVKELLDFTRPMHLECIPVSVNELVREALRRQVPPDVPTTLDLGDVPEIRADGFKILQVIENLLRNGVEAMIDPAGERMPGGVTVTTRSILDGPLAGGVSVAIKDSGTGIKTDDLARIWDPFFTSKTRGSGLGLAVVDRILRAHGGEIRVESTEGHGTTFEIRLGP
jgi:signal transduction histidine kinase